MSKLTLELPESFQRRAALLAGLEGVSFDHFVALAVAGEIVGNGIGRTAEAGSCRREPRRL